MRKREGNLRPYSVPRVTIGALCELLICADLMKRGYDVYRAQSPSCPCDLVIIRGPLMLRVEVKSAQRNALGEITLPIINQRQRDHSDVIACVAADDGIRYFPPLPEEVISDE